MDFEQGLQRFAANGLNLFSSIPVKELPADLHPGAQFNEYSMCVLGHGGRRLWECLSHPLRAEEHPIDTFTLQQVDWFAYEVLRDEHLEILYPRADVVLPLQRLGRFLNLARPSLVGLDINADYGVWFAYRAVFLTRAEIPRVVRQEFVSACVSCEEKPCTRACPAGAVNENTFALKTCMQFRLSENSICADRCLAREACPVKPEHRYSREQISYHMAGLTNLKNYK